MTHSIRASRPLYIPLALLTLSIGACTSAATVACPELWEYPPEWSARLADEIEAAPDDAAFPLAVQDYIGLRDQLRAACD